ncbi:hypothetical protein IF2G_07027 [Cordyceps javanica]|nr:hypothetical protein IF2G_07027 [Cordyceps javanica]
MSRRRLAGYFLLMDSFPTPLPTAWGSSLTGSERAFGRGKTCNFMQKGHGWLRMVGNANNRRESRACYFRTTPSGDPTLVVGAYLGTYLGTYLGQVGT